MPPRLTNLSLRRQRQMCIRDRDIGTLTDEYAFVVDKGGADSILVRDDAREQMPKVLEGIKQVLKPAAPTA